jgi:hypothetical protein
MNSWTEQFDQALKKFFAIDHIDAGLDEEQLARYRDLDPQEAALVYGQDYDLDRVDGPWGR